MTGYVSPIPAHKILDYRVRIEGVPQKRRVHIWTQLDGDRQLCNPAACRECCREAHWTAGQTHG